MKRVLLILVCLAAALLSISTFVWSRSKPLHPVVFSTGDSVILRRLTSGTNHLAPRPRGWPLPRFARSLLFRLRGVNPEFRNLTTAEPCLVLWLEQTSPGNVPSPPTTLTWLMIADETGHTAGKKVPYSRRNMANKIHCCLPNVAPQ